LIVHESVLCTYTLKSLYLQWCQLFIYLWPFYYWIWYTCIIGAHYQTNINTHFT